MLTYSYSSYFFAHRFILLHASWPRKFYLTALVAVPFCLSNIKLHPSAQLLPLTILSLFHLSSSLSLNADLQFISSHITPPEPALHACMHSCTRHICIFLKQTHTNTRSKHVLLGDKSGPGPPPPSCFLCCIKIKTERRCGPPTPSLLAGVIDCDVRLQCTFPVACQPDASWQVRPSHPV